MSNVEPVPLETLCTAEPGHEIQILPPRVVPLGGPRAMDVRRVLPQRKRSLIGAWCFLDSYGPDDVAQTGGMDVPRHPHTGLATVSWLFTGQIDHLDSAGNRAVVRPGEMNLMVAGRGITHQEISTADTSVLHGVQLWYALPESTRDMDHDFIHHVPQPVRGDGSQIRVFIGELAGDDAQVETSTPPLLGAEILLEPGAVLDLGVQEGFEHGVYLDSGALSVDGVAVEAEHLAYIGPGRESLCLEVDDDAESVRLILLGGEPLGEEIVMWWNFIGRTHEDVVAYRAIYQHELGFEDAPSEEILAAAGLGADDEPRFGPYPDGEPDPLPAPPLPNTRLRSRG